jgi:hypothetical protein
VVNSNLEVQGLRGEIKTIYNTKDVNYKFISFPINYSLIVHPLYPLIVQTVIVDKENIKINI